MKPTLLALRGKDAGRGQIRASPPERGGGEGPLTFRHQAKAFLAAC
jgi:hypothetical protein